MIETTEQNLNPRHTDQDLGKGRGVYISTYGCQMNVNDTERMYSLLEMANFSVVNTPEEASVIIINACSVREKPVHKVYSEVGTYRKLKDKNPSIKIGVGGCVGQQEKEKLMKTQPMIDFVFGTDNIDTLPTLVAECFESKEKLVSVGFKHKAPYHVETLVRNPGVSTFVNITKGCDNFCSFCIVPFTRGREKSRPLSHILMDVRQLIKRGVQEVTLLGQNVNSYHDVQPEKTDIDFADLLKAVCTETDILRVRYTTPHPKDFNDKLFQVLADHQDKIGEYAHMPVQSGNSRILKLMNRGYTREEYIEKINRMKSIIPGLVLSTDIIVGFPGETEEEFQDTVSLVKEVGFETIYAYVYSPRPFTKAAEYEEQIDHQVKNERLNRLFEAHEEMAFPLAKKYEGLTLNVLVEKINEQGKAQGRSTQNKMVYFLGPEGASSTELQNLVGKVVPVKVVQAFPNTIRGELVQ